MSEGILCVVATPIGNMDDITLRAIETLREADVVAAEDTRHSRKLFERHQIQTPLLALHEHNESQKASLLVERMKAGDKVALISDAGTPLISDPGFRLVQEAAAAGIRVCPIPGPSAVTAALSVGALPTDRFVFEGFLPARNAARRARLEELHGESRTLVFFESSHRITATLGDLSQVFGPDRQAALCREMTKQFETVLRGRLDELIDTVAEDPMQEKGEFVMVVAGATRQYAAELAAGIEMAQALTEHLPASQAARVAAKLTGASRRQIYESLMGSG